MSPIQQHGAKPTAPPPHINQPTINNQHQPSGTVIKTTLIRASL